jgi:hypothetical protein
MKFRWLTILVAGSALATPAPTQIGTPHPVLLQDFANDGSWLVICQAREDTDHDGKIEVGVGFHGNLVGDAMKPYLVFGSGSGMPIDELVARDDDSTWLAFARHGKLFVSDAAGHATELPGADVRGASSTEASMASDGSRVLYLRSDRGSPAASHIVIRELPSGTERVIDAGGSVWHAMVSDGGHWAAVAVMRPGAQFPHEDTDQAGGACHGRAMASIDGGLVGEAPIVKWLDVDHGVFVDEAKVSPDIRATIQHKPRYSIRSDDDNAPDAKVACTDTGLCKNTETNKPIPLPQGSLVYAFGARVLLRETTKLVVFDASTGTTTPLPAHGEIIDARADIVTFRDGLYDLVTAKRLGGAGDVVLADAPGKLLVGRSAPPCTPKPGDMPYACVDGVADLAAGGRASMPSGPLHWVTR